MGRLTVQGNVRCVLVYEVVSKTSGTQHDQISTARKHFAHDSDHAQSQNSLIPPRNEKAEACCLTCSFVKSKTVGVVNLESSLTTWYGESGLTS